MSAAALPAPNASALAGRFARFIGGLREAMAAGAAHNPVLLDLAARLWNRLTEAADRFAAIAAHPVARSRRRSAAPAPLAADAAPHPPPAPRRTLPRAHGWLARLSPETVAFGIEFADLLAQPEMRALLATAPRLWRVLRPLCRMLGITLPEAAPGTPPLPAPGPHLPGARPLGRHPPGSRADPGPASGRPGLSAVAPHAPAAPAQAEARSGQPRRNPAWQPRRHPPRFRRRGDPPIPPRLGNPLPER